MICEVCGSEMRLDDKDPHSKGNYDLYYECRECETTCIKEVRNGQEKTILWHE